MEPGLCTTEASCLGWSKTSLGWPKHEWTGWYRGWGKDQHILLGEMIIYWWGVVVDVVGAVGGGGSRVFIVFILHCLLYMYSSLCIPYSSLLHHHYRSNFTCFSFWIYSDIVFFFCLLLSICCLLFFFFVFFFFLLFSSFRLDIMM